MELIILTTFSLVVSCVAFLISIKNYIDIRLQAQDQNVAHAMDIEDISKGLFGSAGLSEGEVAQNFRKLNPEDLV